MRPPLPTLGPQPKKSPLGPVLIFSLLLGLAAGGVWWWKGRAPEQEAPPPTAAAPEDAGTPLAAAPEDAGAAPVDPLTASGLSRASAVINGPLETAIVSAAGPEVGPALAQVVTRTLIWWVEVPGELLRGDTLDILYQARPGEEPLVYAVRFASGKTGKTHRAYRFHPEGQSFPRYYLPDGEELELRLENSPLDDYEQVTSLLRDGRRHKGVDFKTPVGTPVKAPFTGVVRRKNWGFRFNGNCLELEEVGGRRRRALFLHLDELPRSLQVGQRFTQGAVIARSGNSGRSFAPHLHYQLEAQDERILDPFETHGTYRHALGVSLRPAFEAEVRRLEALLGTPTAGR
jgi:murein DD-endopeptidase MepM/ murein hydrolase activator NlpD